MTNKGKANKSKAYNNNVSNNSNSFRNKQYNNQFRNNTNRQSASQTSESFPEEEKALKVSSPDLLDIKSARNYIEIDNAKSSEESRVIELPANISDSTAKMSTTNENLNEEENDERLEKEENELTESTVDKANTKIIEQIIDELYQSCFDSNNQVEERQENDKQETLNNVVVVDDDETNKDEEAKSNESVSSASSPVQTDSVSDSNSNNTSKQDEDTVIEQPQEQEETSACLDNAETRVIEKIIDDLYEGCFIEQEKQQQDVLQNNQIQQVEELTELNTASSPSVSSQEIESNENVNQQESQKENSDSAETNKNDVNIIEITPVDLNQLNESSSESSADLEAETNKINELLQDMTDKIITNMVRVENKEHDETSRLLNSSTDLELERDYVIPSYESLEKLETCATTSKVQTATRSSESIQICETPIAPPKKQAPAQQKKRDHEQEASNTCAFCCFI